MANELKIFDYHDKMVRTVTVENEPWWVLKDVCAILGIENHKEVQSRLDNDEVGRFDLPHPQSKSKKLTMVCVNESGLYSIIVRSDKKEAKSFRKWVTSEVLPSIRKTGGYSVNQSQNTDTILESINTLLQSQQQQFSILSQTLSQTQQAQNAQLTALTTLITSTLPRPYKPLYTRWMGSTYAKIDIIATSLDLNRKQTLHKLYMELQDTYDIDLNECRYEYCFAHNLEDTGLYTMNAIESNQQLKQLFEVLIDNYIEQPENTQETFTRTHAS